MLERCFQILAAAAVIAAAAGTARAQLIISEVVHGPLAGGQPRFVEVTNTGTSDVDVSEYSILTYPGGWVGGPYSITMAGNVPLGGLDPSLGPGESWVVNYSATSDPFEDVYGFLPDQWETTINDHDGDDVITLWKGHTSSATLVDVYGALDCDPITTPGTCGVLPVLSTDPCNSPAWGYEHGYAHRCGSEPATTFDPLDWRISGSDALDRCSDEAAEIELLVAWTSPGSHSDCVALPVVYCLAKVNSEGCTPAISSMGTPSATVGFGFTVSCSNVRFNKSGLLFYKCDGSQNNQTFQGGTLCVGPSGIKRTGAQNSGGAGPTPACTGNYSIDMNTFAFSGGPPTPDSRLKVSGTTVHCQWWGRDPGFTAPYNTTLSDGLEYEIGP